MRKLNNPMPSGGAPFTNEDLNDVFQTEVWSAMQGLLSGYNSDAEGVIVSGCVVTPNASNFDMTAGIVYLNGEFMRVDAVTNQTFPKYIKAAAVNNVARIFGDAASKTMIIEKKAEVSATVDGSGQEISILSVTQSGRKLRSPWLTTGITYASGVTSQTTPVSDPIQYKMEDRVLKIRGGINLSGKVSSDVLLTLPLGFRPTKNYKFNVFENIFTETDSHLNPYRIFIGTNGQVNISRPGDTVPLALPSTFCLDLPPME